MSYEVTHEVDMERPIRDLVAEANAQDLGSLASENQEDIVACAVGNVQV